MTISHDHAGNMIDDGTFRYVYDAWNRLVAVKSSTDSGAVTIQTAEFDARGRRMKKVVTNSGDFDAAVVYLFDGHKIIETRDGSDNVVQQFIHGTRYIGNGLWPDELVMMRAIDKGDLYIHQDANWNVIALTDLGGSVVERYVYTPYGQVTVHQETSYGDRDGDKDVDATDKGTPGSTCTGTVSGACRILDLDFDGDYDATDATKFDALDQGLSRHPARTSTGVHQPFAHQGLLYEPELGSYQNRARQYDPGKRRFHGRDRIGPAGGLNLYSYVNNNPLVANDPSGAILCHAHPGTCGSQGDICDDYIGSGRTVLPAATYWRINPDYSGVTGCCMEIPPDNSGPGYCRAFSCVRPGLGLCKAACVAVHEGVHYGQANCSDTQESCECRANWPRDDWWNECQAYTASCFCNMTNANCSPLSCGTLYECCMAVATCSGLNSLPASGLCTLLRQLCSGGP